MIVAVFSFKGGSSKTTTALNLAAALDLAGASPLRIVALDKDQAVLDYAAALPAVRFVGAAEAGTELRAPFAGITLIDGPPALSRQSAAALMAGCDVVLIPAHPARGACQDALDLCRVAAEQGKPSRVLMTRYDRRLSEAGATLDRLRADIKKLKSGARLLDIVIPFHAGMVTAENACTTIFHSAPRSHCARAHRQLAEEVLSWQKA